MARAAFVALGLLCLSFGFAVGESDPWANDKDTIVVHASNFSEVIAQHKIVMVEFYTPWCGHCRAFAPEYARAATDLKKDGITLAKMNCDDEANHPLAHQYGVRGFPTIRIFKKMFDSKDKQLGTVENFEVERTYDLVVNHMRDLAMPPAELGAEHIDAVLEQHVKSSPTEVSVVVLGLFESDSTPAALSFKEAAFGKQDPPVWVWTKDAAAMKKYLPDGYSGKEAVVIITKFRPEEGGPYFAMPSKDIDDAEKIADFVDVYGNPMVWHYSNELSPQITGGRLQKFVWAFSDNEHWAAYTQAMKAVAKDNRGKLKFVQVSAEHEPLLQFFNIDKDSLPQVMLIDLHPTVGQRQFKFGTWDDVAKGWNTEEAKRLDTSALTSFIEKYEKDGLKRFLRSEAVPQAQEGPVKVVVSNTFEDEIRTDKDVLMMFYGDHSWCEHCKIFDPEFELIGKQFEGNKHITVAKLNFGRNDIEDAKARGIAPKGFPELALFRAGEFDKPPIVFDPKKYNDERGLPAVTQFVKDHSSLKFELQGGTHGGKKREEL